MPDDVRDVTATPIDPTDETISPVGYLSVTLEEDELTVLEQWIDGHLKQIETEMQPHLDRFEEERHQFEGTMPSADYPYPGAFRLNHPITKKKVRETANRAKQAYLDSDPIWAITVGDDPTLREPAQQVEKALDEAVRNDLNAVDPLAQAQFEAVLHGTGFVLTTWLYEEAPRRIVGSYRGFDGLTSQSLADLQRFEQDFPTWQEESSTRALHAQLARGEDVTREFSYTAAIHNHPSVVFLPCKDVKVYPMTDGIEGLRTTPVYGYQKTYTRQQLQQFVDQRIIDAALWERMRPVSPMASEEPNPKDEQETHDIAHLTVRYRLDEQERRYQVWFERKTKKALRVRHFPWFHVEPDLHPIYIRQEMPGFFKPGLAWDLKDEHTCLNVVLNLFLNGMDLANSMRFKAKQSSPAYYYILSKRWSPHLPLPWKENENEVTPMVMPMGHLETLVEALELLRRDADESTGTTALQSGRESPTDKRAPATKSMLLLQQVEPNLKEYLRSMEPGMEDIGRALLWLYYQGLALGWIDTFPGVPTLQPEQLLTMADRLHPRALLFEFDRVGRAERNLTVVELLAKFAPQAVPVALKIAISQMDSQWARQVASLPLTPQAPPGMPGSPPPTGSPGQAPPMTNGNGSTTGDAMGGRLADLAGMMSGNGMG